MRKAVLALLLPFVLFAQQGKSGYIPPRQPAAAPPKQVIFLDPGHGGFDVGARMHGVNEKSLTLSTALLVRKYLKERNYRVIMTRMRDVFIPLDQRSSIANRTRSHLFVSFHFNAAKSSDANGIEVFYYDSKDKIRASSSRKLARLVQNRMIEKTGARDRGIKGGNFHVIRETKMPAILIEGGFITNDKERTKLSDLNYRDKLAHAITDGVDTYFKS
jgi:N-acetylmuramoyl-L-alanine amidase